MRNDDKSLQYFSQIGVKYSNKSFDKLLSAFLTSFSISFVAKVVEF